MRLRSLFIGAFLVILLPVSAAAFFGSFGKIQQDLDQLDGGGTSEDGGLADVLEQLEEVTGVSTVLFYDVPEDAWYYSYVKAVAEWGIVSGYSDANGKSLNQFGPANPVTIAEILKMALRAAQIDESQCRGMPRLQQAMTHWASSFVVCAEQMNMRLFAKRVDLNRPAKRAEVLSVIHDAFGDTVPPLFSTFSDTEGHPLESDVAYAAALGVVSGDDGKNTFGPNRDINRAEAAKIIYEKLRLT